MDLCLSFIYSEHFKNVVNKRVASQPLIFVPASFQRQTDMSSVVHRWCHEITIKHARLISLSIPPGNLHTRNDYISLQMDFNTWRWSKRHLLSIHLGCSRNTLSMVKFRASSVVKICSSGMRAEVFPPGPYPFIRDSSWKRYEVYVLTARVELGIEWMTGLVCMQTPSQRWHWISRN